MKLLIYFPAFAFFPLAGRGTPSAVLVGDAALFVGVFALAGREAGLASCLTTAGASFFAVTFFPTTAGTAASFFPALFGVCLTSALTDFPLAGRDSGLAAAFLAGASWTFFGVSVRALTFASTEANFKSAADLFSVCKATVDMLEK